ncbi:MAG: filamentous hemagglutinin, partial [Cyanobacteria bacterium J06606_4]
SGSGAAGEVVADVEHLSITDGGYFGSSTLGSGRGGDVTVEEADTILISGATPTGVPSIMTANTAGLTGDSGNLRIDTRELIVQESGLLTSSSIGVGNAGNVVVNASERVLISGEQQNLLPSSISSTVDFPPLAYQLLLGLSGTPKGAAGSVTITTPDLSIQDDSAVAVINMGEGDAGYIQITADKISLDRGYLDALTMDGTGGEIDLTVESLLLARNVSLIQTSAQGGDGDGGDISISAPIILGLGNSDITANAFQGNGGNIDITTQQLLGFEFQEQLTDGDDITASSEFGLSGTVDVNGFEVSPHAD